MKTEMIIKENSVKKFSVRSRLKSFQFAFEGLIEFFRTQHNAFIHLAMTLCVIAASLFFPLSKTESIAIFFSIGFVWCAELFNTAVEKLCDLISEEYHPKIKFIKDVSAAAVLIAAITVFSIGLIIFIPKIFL